MSDSLRRDFESIYRAALAAVDPAAALKRKLLRSGNTLHIDGRRYRLDRFPKVFVIGAGKAGLAMTQAVLDLVGDRIESGIVVVRDLPAGVERVSSIRVLAAGHPEPDQRGVLASSEIIRFLQDNLSPDDLLLVLISGGGSALLPAPVQEISLAAKQQMTRLLLDCGADISEINVVRKHLSRLKGGRLLDYTRDATVLSLIVSDVVGDDLSSIASGLTAPDPSTFADCLTILRRYSLVQRSPAAVLHYFEDNAGGDRNETLKSSDPRFESVHHSIVATNRYALEAAADAADRLGYPSRIVSASVRGDVGDLVGDTLHRVEEILQAGTPMSPPCCVLSGGETTVQVVGDGRGGRNQEFALRCVTGLARWQGSDLLLASLGTDGSDGPTDAAGALVTPTSAARALQMGLDLDRALARNDSYPFFDSLGDLIFTGPTGTNVMDLHFSLFGTPQRGRRTPRNFAETARPSFL